MTVQPNFSTASLRRVLQNSLAVEPNSTVQLAFSGGMDSHVLLHALSRIAQDYPFSLTAIHVNHALQASSSDWAEHCQNICDDLCIPLIIRSPEIVHRKGESLEAVARAARYEALADCLPEAGLCMTAQHLNDQTETLLLQLFRGAGVHGLAAMPASKTFSKGMLLRPLLEYSREDLFHYAHRHNLEWIEDPSNQDNRFDRNFLRNEILPGLRERWTGLDKNLSRSSRHAASAATLLDQRAIEDLRHCEAVSNHYFPPAVSLLNADVLAEFSTTHQINALRHWVKMHGLVVPNERRMQSVVQLLTRSGRGKGEVTWPGGGIVLDRNKLWLFKQAKPVQVAEPVLEWSLSAPLTLAGQVLSASLVKNEGLAKSLLNKSVVRVGFRQGNEQCRMPGKHGYKSLKTLFQDLSVPAWLRARVPLIFLGEELVAVPSLWVNPHFFPAPDEEGYVFSVQHQESDFT